MGFANSSIVIQRLDAPQRRPDSIRSGPADEFDHRLAINVVRAMGPEVLRRAFTLENLHWLCRLCHRRKTGPDRRLARRLESFRSGVVRLGHFLREIVPIRGEVYKFKG